MAEFAEVMKQVYCMCNEYKDDGCCKCPLLLKGGRCRFQIYCLKTKPKKLERLIMDWAAERPEPVYPSWIDAWQQLFPGAKNVPCPKLYFGDVCQDVAGEGCFACKMSPIPAEIAKKLGIRPIEIKKPVSCGTCKYSDKSVWQAPCLACKRAHGDCYPDQREGENDAEVH